MKKILLSALGVLFALPGLAQTFTYEYEGQTLPYTVLDEEARTCGVELPPYSKDFKVSGSLVIPQIAKDGDIEYTVSYIGSYAFFDCSSLTSVTIPESVTLIGDDAFSGCSSLTSVPIPESVTSIGNGAFYGCSSLTSVSIPESFTSIGDNVFSGCSSLISITIPESVTSIGNGAFGGCPLTTVKLPDALISLGSGAFGNTRLTEIILPESLKTIGDGCFMQCPLTAVKFGQNIERIGSNAFSRLSQFEVNGNLVSLGDKAFGDNFRLLKISRDNPPQLDSKNMGYTDDEAYNILVIVPANGDDIYKNDPKWEGFHIVETAPTKTVYMTGNYSLAEEITTTTQQMPGNVTSLAIVGPLADGDWNIIKRNLISCYDLDLSGVTNTEIPAETFADNQHILTLKLPNGLKTIGDKTFFGCTNLTIGELPASVESIGESAFENCTVFNVNELPESLRTIGVKAFANCSRLQISALPPVESIGEYAFYNCPRLMDLDMSAARFNVIEGGTFANCTKLRNIILPETLTAINGKEAYNGMYFEGAFGNTAVNFIDFPESLEKIGGNAFMCTPLISIELPGVTTIDPVSFQGCSKMKSISFSSKMESIGENAFLNCRGIKSISVPKAVPPTVGENAFQNVRYRDVVVSIPTTSYRDYLNAPSWGAFTQLANSIFLEYEEVDENGNALTEEETNEDNVEVGTVENGTYDEIVNNIVSEEEQAAEDKARDEALYGDEPVAQAEIAARVKRARAAARAEAEYTADAKARQAFSRLYTGQSMTIGDNTGYRVKIQPKEGVEIVKIEFGGKDITDTYIDGMVTLPALYSRSSLKVYRRSTNVGVENVTGSDRNATADVYNLQGIVVLRDATEAQVSRLNPGMYIYKGRKIVIR